MQFQAELNNMDTTFLHPVITELSEQVASELLIANEIKVRNLSDNRQRASRGSMLSARFQTGYDVDHYSVDVIATEEVTPDKLGNAGLSVGLNPAIWLDSATGARVNPTYVESTLKISFTIRSRSRSESDYIVSRIRSMIARGTEARTTSIQYSYLIPVPVLATLSALHDIKVADTNDTETLADWNKRCWCASLTTLTDPTGTGISPAIRESQVRVIGHYRYKDSVSREEKDESGFANVTFDYEVILNRPHSLLVYYPAIINQKPIPKAMRVDLGVSYNKGKTYMGTLDNALTTMFDGTKGNFDILRYPSYDDWTPKIYPTYSVPIIVNAVAVDASRTLIGNLKEFPNFAFTDETLAYLTKTRTDMVIPNNALFYIGLYRGDSLLTAGVSIDADLTVHSNKPMDFSSNYHLVIFLTATPNQIPESKRYIPVMYPDMVRRYLKGFNVGYTTFPARLTKANLVEWWEYLNTRYLNYPNDRIGIYCPEVFSITSSVGT